jgi:heme-degrading monooxygenase HmoA
MPVLLIARWDGDVETLKSAYDRAHRLIGERGGAPGELRHHCATDEGALYIVGVWESEEKVRARFASQEFEETLTGVGFPSPKSADITILQLHAIEPPL